MTRRELVAQLDHARRQAVNQGNPEAERALWRAIAAELRTYLGLPEHPADQLRSE